MTGRRLLRAGAAGAFALVMSGCAVGGVDLGELPTDPIAVTWWEPEEARRRAELLEVPEIAPQRRGVARVEAIGDLLGARGQRAGLSRYPGRLCLVDPWTAEVTPVRAIPRGAIPLSWSDDHARLLFLSNHRGVIQVYEWVRATDEVRTVTSGPHPHMFADYGRGSQIAFLEVVSEGGRAFERVYVTDPQGRSPRLVFEDRHAQTIHLSPDGRTLLYVRRNPQEGVLGDPRPELVAIDLETGGEQRRGPGREPSFSPIGDWIVYSAPSRAGWRLRRMRADGSARSPIAAAVRDEEMPSVSPDGQFVVYVGEATGLERLFVRRLDGSGDRILLESGAVYSPVW